VVSREEADEILADCWHSMKTLRICSKKKAGITALPLARGSLLVLSRRAGRRDEVHGPGGCEGEATLGYD